MTEPTGRLCGFCRKPGHTQRTCRERLDGIARRAEQDRVMGAMFAHQGADREPSVPDDRLRREVEDESVIPCSVCRKPASVYRACRTGCGVRVARCSPCAIRQGVDGWKAFREQARAHELACLYVKPKAKRRAEHGLAASRGVEQRIDELEILVEELLEKIEPAA